MSDSKDLRKEAFEMFQHGIKMVDIAKQLDVPAGTVRRWKHSDGWERANVQETNVQANAKSERSEDVHKQQTVRTYKVEEKAKPAEKNAEITEKQRLFCLFYVRYFNATKAYQKAYECSYNTAKAAGYRLLQNAEIRAEIGKLKEGRLNQQMLDESDVFQKFMDIAFSDITDYVEFGREEVPVMGPFGPIMVKDDKTGKMREIKKEVNVVRFREHGEVDGTIISEIKQGKDGASIKLADRVKALAWLADHMDMATAEQKARIEKLEAEAERIRSSNGPESENDGVEIVNDCPT